MATIDPTPNFIIIWLDQYIGLLRTHLELKTTVSEQLDPEKVLPTSPSEKNIDMLIQFHENIEENFKRIPKNLQMFSEVNECLKCIEENYKIKKIFFITSGSMGKLIAGDIIQKYSALEKIYVFCGYYKAHVEWADDCLDNGIECIMNNFHTDLLARLLRDVAEYFIREGDRELTENKMLAYSANIYFSWAKLLLERANKVDGKTLTNRLIYTENRINMCEKLIKELNKDDDNEKESHETHE